VRERENGIEMPTALVASGGKPDWKGLCQKWGERRNNHAHSI